MSKTKEETGKKGKKLFIILGIIAAVIIAVVLIFITVIMPKIKNLAQNALSEAAVDISYVNYQNLDKSVSVSGTIESSNVVVVSPEVANSKIKKVNVSLGDHVKKGDVLCEYDDADIAAQIKELESEVSIEERLAAHQNAVANRTLNDARTDKAQAVNKATKTYNNAKAAYEAAVNVYNSATPGDADQAYSVMIQAKEAMDTAYDSIDEISDQYDDAITSATDQITVSTIQGETSSATVKQLEELYKTQEKLKVTAEISGIITQLNVSQGSIPTGTLMQIEDDSKLKVKVSLTEKNVLQVEKGMKCIITNDALPDEEFTGKVTQVINFASSSNDSAGQGGYGYEGSQGGSSYSAVIEIDDPGDLLLGMSAKVNIMIGDSDDMIAVPYTAIMTEEGGDQYVFIADPVDAGGLENMYVVSIANVTQVAEGDYYVGVNGLDEGALVVVDPGSGLVYDGATISGNLLDDMEITVEDGNDSEE